MSTPRGYRDRSEDGLLTLLGDVPELVRNLVTAEVDSAKRWVKSAGKDAGMGGVWFLIALFVLFWTIPAIGAFTIIGLASWMPAWLASLIVVGIGLLAIAVFAFLGLLRLRRLTRTTNPVQAVATDARIVKDIANEY